MVWSRIRRINMSKAACPRLRFQVIYTVRFLQVPDTNMSQWSIYTATWNTMGRSCCTKNNSYVSELLKKMVTVVWQVGTQSGHILFLLHNWFTDAWWLWGIQSTFGWWCEQCRVALCVHCLYCGPSGHLTALAAVHQKTTGLLLRGRVVQCFRDTAYYFKQHNVHHILMQILLGLKTCRQQILKVQSRKRLTEFLLSSCSPCMHGLGFFGFFLGGGFVFFFCKVSVHFLNWVIFRIACSYCGNANQVAEQTAVLQ